MAAPLAASAPVGALAHRRRDGTIGHAGGLELAQLALQVGLQAAAVLALERLEVLDLAVEVFALGLELAHHLLVALLGLALERVGPAAGVVLDLGDLGRALGVDLVGTLTRVSEQAVGL